MPPHILQLLPFAASLGGVLILSSAMVGVGALVLLKTIFNTLYSEDLEQDEEWRYDVNRINELRRHSLLYRLFQPLIQAFARINHTGFREHLPEINREIQASGMPRFWTAEEYLARIELLALFMSPLFFYLCVGIMGPVGMIMGLVLTILSGYMLRRALASRARYRLFLIKQRMPFLLDLLTLLMEAGSTFMQSLSESVDEFRGHPVGVEFGRVLAEISMGKSRTEALEAMRDRLLDDEITSIVGSIVQGEVLGTPLAQLFRTQADVLRIKRTQRAETIAGEAGVTMLLPTILVMASTVIIILGPFVLGFIYADFMS